ncbi:MAG: hypothetical protein ACKO6L_10390, partial [Flavobacteriales bacterium]
LQATKQQWLAEYLMHYDEAHFQTPFRTQQALLLKDSVYLATYEGNSEVYMLAALCDFYLPLFKKSIRLHHLPEDLQYLPAAISGCNPQFSWSDRAGLWGLTIGEANRIGLRVDENIDERRGGDFTTEAWCKELESRFAQQDLKGLLTSLYGELDAIRLTERIHRLKTIFSEIQNQNFLSVCMEGFALTSPIRFDENCSILALGALSGVDTTLVRQLNPIFVGAYFPTSEKKNNAYSPHSMRPHPRAETLLLCSLQRTAGFHSAKSETQAQA